MPKRSRTATQLAGARGRADQREGRQVEVRVRRRTCPTGGPAGSPRLPDRGSPRRGVEPVDLVDEQHVARLERGQDPRQVAFSLERRSGDVAGRHRAPPGPYTPGSSCPGRAGPPATRDPAPRSRVFAAVDRVVGCSFNRSWPTNSASLARPAAPRPRRDWGRPPPDSGRHRARGLGFGLVFVFVFLALAIA